MSASVLQSNVQRTSRHDGSEKTAIWALFLLNEFLETLSKRWDAISETFLVS